jgi:RNA polymerase sigma factor (sigma-70 family)
LADLDAAAAGYPGFEDWYRAEHPRVLAALTLVSGDVDLAREATDEAFARALLAWRRVSAMERPGGWLYTVALNGVRRQARRRSKERELLAGVPDPPPGLADRYGEVWSVVQTLPPRQRAAVVMKYLLDMRDVDIAAAMKIAPGTVASTLSAARARLAGQLFDDESEARR